MTKLDSWTPFLLALQAWRCDPAKPTGSAQSNLTTGASVGRLFEREPQDFAVALVGQGVNRPTGALRHVPDAWGHGTSPHVHDPLTVKRGARDRQSRQGSDAEGTRPGWDGI